MGGGAIVRGGVVRGELVRGNCPGSKSPGGNCPEGNFMEERWAIVRVAVVQGRNVRIPSYLYNLFFIIILIKSNNINLRGWEKCLSKRCLIKHRDKLIVL